MRKIHYRTLDTTPMTSGEFALARRYFGWTVVEMATVLGVNEFTVRRWEAAESKHVPNPNVREKFAQCEVLIEHVALQIVQRWREEGTPGVVPARFSLDSPVPEWVGDGVPVPVFWSAAALAWWKWGVRWTMEGEEYTTEEEVRAEFLEEYVFNLDDWE